MLGEETILTMILGLTACYFGFVRMQNPFQRTATGIALLQQTPPSLSRRNTQIGTLSSDVDGPTWQPGPDVRRRPSINNPAGELGLQPGLRKKKNTNERNKYTVPVGPSSSGGRR